MSGAHVYSPAEKRMALAAVLIVLFLSALDQTIVATAMPRIVKELAGLERIAWVATAYLLTSTVTVPVYGKLGDIYGRKPVIMFGVVVFLVGSMLCGLSGEFGTLPVLGDGMRQLVVFRAIQGIGAGALTTGAFATVADIAPPAERGKYTGLFGAMFGLAGLAGPVLGGWLTDHATTEVFGHVVSGWRFVFYVNLPLGLIALYILVRHLPPARRGVEQRIDWLGSGLVVATAVPLLLALSWIGEGTGGGEGQGWTQPRILAGLALAVLGLAAYVVTARGRNYAVVPLALFGDAAFTRAVLALFVINLAYMGVPMFMPLYLQIVWGMTAAQSGTAMLPLLFGILLGSMIAGRSARLTQQVKPVILAGGALTLVALLWVSSLDRDTSQLAFRSMLFLLGLGLGPAQGMYTLAIQSTVSHDRVGVATASAQFFRQIGATIGIALFGALMTLQLGEQLTRLVPDMADLTLSQAQVLAMDKAALAAAPGATAATGPALRLAFEHAIVSLFPVALGLMAIGVAVSVAMPARRLRGRDQPAGAPDSAEAASA